MVKVIDSTEKEKENQSNYQAIADLVKGMFGNSFQVNLLGYSIHIHNKSEDKYNSKIVVDSLGRNIIVHDKKYFNDAVVLAERFEQNLLIDKGIECVINKAWIAD